MPVPWTKAGPPSRAQQASAYTAGMGSPQTSAVFARQAAGHNNENDWTGGGRRSTVLITRVVRLHGGQSGVPLHAAASHGFAGAPLLR
jgi:hypothetical protein